MFIPRQSRRFRFIVNKSKVLFRIWTLTWKVNIYVYGKKKV